MSAGPGTLTGVADLVTEGANYCALLTSGAADCWGYGFYGDLGNAPVLQVRENEGLADTRGGRVNRRIVGFPRHCHLVSRFG